MQVQISIRDKLGQALAPVHLEVINESRNHNVPPNSETHFKVVAVAGAFSGENAVKRHRRVYDILSEEMAGTVHALSLHLYTPEEWSTAAVPDSPPCLGGSSLGGGNK